MSQGTNLDDEPRGWPEDARRDRLIGDWHLYQRTGGHRTSTDDLVTAWYATKRFQNKPEKYLDLGCGVGSVLLMVCHRLRPVHSLGIEAQPQSFEMATRGVRELPEKIDIQLMHSDFRDAHFAEASFDLVTGSPPYFPFNAGVLPKDSQRRACRFEARGGVEAYCETAARALTPHGKFYLVHQTAAEERVRKAAEDAQLFMTGRAEFFMRRDREKPFLCVWEFSPSQVQGEVDHFACAVRDADGEITREYQRLRKELGVA